MKKILTPENYNEDCFGIYRIEDVPWHDRNIIVLKPESLRLEMIGILKDMAKSYETGECLNGEE
ncbi:hypothetical protein ONT16_15845 [Prevotella copri]|jgi:hypothetical protein|uniref:Uncharacterized protein n=1 Tax=Segatella copri TaxID=165179 RepID=A0AAP3BEW9_9BACT|nr:hypothetical protein [Segatella copri]MCW4129688.1 hypothetical protein [Segatella copri]MCW4416176.1 hypothetical protein [Segatella copri]MCW4422690.1 hypothetical protein [Segatella copri]